MARSVMDSLQMQAWMPSRCFSAVFGHAGAGFELVGFLRARPAGPAGAGLGPGHAIGHVEIVALAGRDDDVVAALGQRGVDLDIAPADDEGLVLVDGIAMRRLFPAAGDGALGGDVVVDAADELGLDDARWASLRSRRRRDDCRAGCTAPRASCASRGRPSFSIMSSASGEPDQAASGTSSAPRWKMPAGNSSSISSMIVSTNL